VRPVLDSVFSLEQTVAAFEASKAGRARGKIVVQVQADNAH
jgi:NADPH:quinone reductase-like Zn-dependent oxidoreductase